MYVVWLSGDWVGVGCGEGPRFDNPTNLHRDTGQGTRGRRGVFTHEDKMELRVSRGPE